MSVWEDRLFIAGEWVESKERTPNFNPYNNKLIANVCQATASDLEFATAAAYSAAADFYRLPRHAKARMCRLIAEGISARAEQFTQLITQESGKPLKYAGGEVERAITTFTLASHDALRFAGEVIPLDITERTENYIGHSIRMPLGPVAAISPFNFPLNLVAHKIAPALAVGCPVVLKPAPQTPLTALLLARVIEECGVPPGAVSVLPMAVKIAESMVQDERFGVLSFTGSAKVGWHLKAIAGRKRVLLELGGNAPAIVHSDADITDAVSRLVPGSFAAAGQVCIKAQRLFLHSSIYDKFMRQFIEATKSLAVGDPADPETVVGPLIDSKSADRIESWIAEAKADGASVILEGKRKGNILYPTVLTDVPPDAKCRTEEIFGPVVIVDRYDNFPDAINRANATAYGLQAAVFTFDTRIVEQASRELEYGGVIVNDSPMVRVDNYPYGGTKASGFGREGVRYAMEEFTEPRMIVQRTTF